MPEPGTTAAEQAALKQEFDELRQRVNSLESRHQGVLAGLSRRQLLAIAGASGGAGAIGAFGAQPAAGAAQDSGGEGDVGSTGSPFEGFADGMAMVTQSVNTSTTINKPVVLADSALGSLTLDIDAALEGPSGFSQMVTVIDETGNAGSNSITVEASDGTTIATIDADDAWFQARWDSGAWVTKRFIPTVEAGQVTAGAAAMPLDAGSEVSGSRSYDTEFENTTGHTITVQIELELTGASGSDVVNALLAVGSSSGLTTDDRVDIWRDDNAESEEERQTLYAEVPDGFFYVLIAGSGNEAGIDRWVERERV